VLSGEGETFVVRSYFVSSGFTSEMVLGMPCSDSAPTSKPAQQICSNSNLSQKILVGRWCTLAGSHLSLSLRIEVCHPATRIRVRLLGPCYETGQLKPFRQHLECARAEARTARISFLSPSHGITQRKIRQAAPSVLRALSHETN